jgi:energy-coupling factor transporter ATP-binding protein EcfA2
MDTKNNLRRKQFLKRIWKIRLEILKIDELIGIYDIKDQLCNHILFVVYGQKIKFTYVPMRHVIVTGKSGCGKTTFSNILAVLMNKLHDQTPNCVIHGTRSNMIGSFVGHTAKLTQAVIDSAKGGVLLIDEAYALGDPGGADSTNPDTFARACVNTLNQNLTEKSQDFICIVIGYQKNIERNLFSQNEGLRRRFNVQFHFKEYRARDLFNFFCMFSEKQGITFQDENHRKRIKLIFSNERKSFTNQVASVKNLIQVTCTYIVRRNIRNSFVMSKIDKTLSEEDMKVVFRQYKTAYNIQTHHVMSSLYM